MLFGLNSVNDIRYVLSCIVNRFYHKCWDIKNISTFFYQTDKACPTHRVRGGGLQDALTTQKGHTDGAEVVLVASHQGGALSR